MALLIVKVADPWVRVREWVSSFLLLRVMKGCNVSSHL